MSAVDLVFDHHLGACAIGLDEVLKDYSEISVIVTPEKTYRGIAEIRAFYRAFLDSIRPEFWDAFNVTSRCTEGEIAYLTWEAKPFVTSATDTLYIKGDKILVQTFTSLTA
ncbi:nuclear transport factor 2 family protein [Burkholderia sp. Ac-20384]|uniref:nuclear transport factor 2 family protein n=1 Tax=Burkholderia sp. Ac-20384 TaxID=2703902 RepID=UPI0019813E0D|nr:nuclear transport factor 2 family protein [Burkholderia sp. Ac-20384]MBN3823767.1 nuclear transport factor 2 family protein [Burkholderia sp. Ac-20384]